jgi:hypothetical protein
MWNALVLKSGRYFRSAVKGIVTLSYRYVTPSLVSAEATRASNPER